MKIREGNIFKKEEFIPPSKDCVLIREKAKQLHRLFNPKKVTNEPKDSTVKYRTVRDAIRKSKHTGNPDDLLKILNDLEILVKVIEVLRKSTYTHKIRLHPKDIGRKPKRLNKLLPSKPSMFNQNTAVLNALGFKPRLSKSKLKRERRREERTLLKLGGARAEFRRNLKLQRKIKKEQERLKQAS